MNRKLKAFAQCAEPGCKEEVTYPLDMLVWAEEALQYPDGAWICENCAMEINYIGDSDKTPHERVASARRATVDDLEV